MSARNFGELVAEAMQAEVYFGSEAPCPARYEPGAAESKLLIVTGDNASGKSFFCKYFRALHGRRSDNKNGIEIIDGGMHRRTMSGIERAFLYGDETTESTDDISISFVLTGLNTCRTREKPHIFSMDEPDVGLSEGYIRPLAELIENFLDDSPVLTTGLILVTHSRQLVRPLLDLQPHLVRVGDDGRSTRRWVDEGPRRRTIQDLENLSKESVERFRAIQAVINGRQKSR